MNANNKKKDAQRILSEWISKHVKNPYPTENQKYNLALRLGMSKTQVNNWFVNTRKVKCSISVILLSPKWLDYDPLHS